MSFARQDSTPVSGSPCILVAGAPRVGKSRLRQCITNTAALSIESSIPWAIETKYYTARVEVCEASAEVGRVIAQPEALVLVFSLAVPRTFELAQSFGAQFDLEAMEVKLVCGTYADALLAPNGTESSLVTASQQEWFHQAADWSAENGFEFIVCCPAVPTLDDALALDGDRQGVARVVEALHAHAWPNLNMLPQGQHGPPGRATHGAYSEDSADPGSGRGRHASPCALGARSDQSTEAVALKQQEQGQGQLPDDKQKACLQPGRSDTDPESANTERVLDGLERLMDEMEEHKSRLATLPDEERREQAAALALRMLEVLGVDDEGSGSDSA